MLASEKAAVEARLEPGAVDKQVAAEVEAARRAAEAQARVEVEALQQRLRCAAASAGPPLAVGKKAAGLRGAGGCSHHCRNMP